MTAETNKQAVRRLVEEGWNKGNLDVLDELVSPTFQDHQPLPPGLPPGLAGAKAFIASNRVAFPDLKSTIEDLTADGDRVWYRLTAQGTNAGPFMGMPPTGKRVAVEVIGLIQLADGKAMEHWAVADNLGMMQQLGLVPAPGLAARGAR